MPRYKEYNEFRVVEKAMYQFWEGGYEATSLSVLTRSMGINKFSFYDAFQSKEALLMRTMKHFYEHHVSQCIQLFETEKEIMPFLRKILEPRNGYRGCYILAITAEIGDRSKDVVNFLREYLQELENRVRYCITSQHQDIDSDETEQMTRQVMALITSIPLICSIKSPDICLDYAGNVLKLIGVR